MRVKHLTVTRNRSIPGALAAAVLLSLLVVGSASGALFVILEPTSGPPGTEVTGRTGGDGAFASQVDPLPTYLVAKAAADSVTSPEDPGLIPIGELIVDEGGNGRISFLVPQVEPGDYVVIAFCPSCAPFNAGWTMAPVADFHVTSSPPATDTVPVDPARWPGLIALLAAQLLTVVLLAALRQRLMR